DAVDAAAAFEDPASFDQYDFTAGVQLAERLGADFVARIVERTQDDCAVADVVVDVRPIHDLAIGAGDSRGFELDDLEGATARIGARPQPGEILSAHLVVGVRGVRLYVSNDKARSHPRRDHVDVPARAE